MKHPLGFVWCFLVAATAVHAQQTAVYTDPLQPYKTATELYQQKKYGAALQEYNRFLNNADAHALAASYHEQYLDALFYRAEASNELDQPQAENYFLALVTDHEATPVTRMATYYLGNLYYKKKKYDQAIAWFNKTSIADLNAEQANEYRFQLGYCYFFRKKFDQADAQFNVIKTVQNKYYYPANYYHAYIAYAQGRYDEASKSFNVVKDTKLYSPVVPYYTASLAYLKSDYAQAIDLAQTALTNDKLKYQDELKQLIGKSYFNLKQYDKALPYLKDYYDKVSKSSKADIYQVGYCQYKLGKYDDAIKSFTQLNAQQDSLGQNALYLLADCYLKTNQKTNARNAFAECSRLKADARLQEEAAYEYAKLSYDLGYSDVAARSVQTFITDYPHSKHLDEARELLTDIFLSTNNYRDAVSVIQAIENKTPRVKQAYQKVAYGRGLQLYNEGNYNDALRMFEVSLNNPIDMKTQALCYFWKGESYYALNKFPEANLNYFKFLEAAKPLSDLPLDASVAAANYGVGYAFLRKEDYSKALPYFEKSRELMSGTVPKNKDERAYRDKVYPDGLLRLGDCYFALKDYTKAGDAYAAVINNKMSGSDYALYQRAMISGLQGNTSAKLKDLETLGNNFGMSVYQDDALFETGDTYLKNEQYENAILVFNRIIHDYPNSSYVKDAYVKLGLIYYNTNRFDNALESYRTVATKYPTTNEGKDAREGIREIYLAKNDAAGLIKEMDQLPNAKVSASERDSVVYLAAERQFSSGNCDAAMRGFGDYINSYPYGAFAADAHYYRATCLVNNKDYSNALADFQFIIEKRDARFLEKSLLQAARIEMNTKDYDNALKHYTQLNQSADFKANRAEARKGILESAFALKNYDAVKAAADDIANDANAPADDVNEANYYLGNIATQANQYTDAIAYYTKVAKATETEIGARATYGAAEAYFKLDDLKNAEAWAYKVIKQKPTYDYWLAKSYMLVADIFFKQGDYFNAKSTLQSIVDHYTAKDDIVPAAKEKLQAVTAKENEQSKVNNDNKPVLEEDNASNDSTQTSTPKP